MESIVLCHQFCEWSIVDDQFTLKGMILFLSYQWDKSGCARCLTAIWHHRNHSLPEEFLDWRRQMVQAGHWTWNKPRSAISVIGIHQILIKLCFLSIVVMLWIIGYLSVSAPCAVLNSSRQSFSGYQSWWHNTSSLYWGHSCWCISLCPHIFRKEGVL